MIAFYLIVSAMALVGLVCTGLVLRKHGLSADALRNWPLFAYTVLSFGACIPFGFGVQMVLGVSAALVAAVSIVELTWPGLILKVLEMASWESETWLKKNIVNVVFLLAAFCFLSAAYVLRDDAIGAMVLLGASATLIGFGIWVLKKCPPDTSIASIELPAEAPSEAVGSGR